MEQTEKKLDPAFHPRRCPRIPRDESRALHRSARAPVLFLAAHHRPPLGDGLMKYRVSIDYQQADGPPAWASQDNIVLVPKNIVPKTKAFVAGAVEGNPQLAAAGQRLVE